MGKSTDEADPKALCPARTEPQGATGPEGEAQGEERHDHSSVRSSRDTVGWILYEQ